MQISHCHAEREAATATHRLTADRLCRHTTVREETAAHHGGSHFRTLPRTESDQFHAHTLRALCKVRATPEQSHGSAPRTVTCTQAHPCRSGSNRNEASSMPALSATSSIVARPVMQRNLLAPTSASPPVWPVPACSTRPSATSDASSPCTPTEVMAAAALPPSVRAMTERAMQSSRSSGNARGPISKALPALARLPALVLLRRARRSPDARVKNLLSVSGGLTDAKYAPTSTNLVTYGSSRPSSGAASAESAPPVAAAVDRDDGGGAGPRSWTSWWKSLRRSSIASSWEALRAAASVAAGASSESTAAGPANLVMWCANTGQSVSTLYRSSELSGPHTEAMSAERWRDSTARKRGDAADEARALGGGEEEADDDAAHAASATAVGALSGTLIGMGCRSLASRQESTASGHVVTKMGHTARCASSASRRSAGIAERSSAASRCALPITRKLHASVGQSSLKHRARAATLDTAAHLDRTASAKARRRSRLSAAPGRIISPQGVEKPVAVSCTAWRAAAWPIPAPATAARTDAVVVPLLDADLDGVPCVL